MERDNINIKKLSFQVAIRYLGFIVFMYFFFFLPAGEKNYWEAWAYMIMLLTPMLLVTIYLLKRNPALLLRRMRSKEKETTQKKLMAFSSVFFMLFFILPGFDHRFGWSEVPLPLAIVSLALVFLGYMLFVRVLLINSYLSRTVEVEPGQQLITSGPYRFVRHPMYTAFLVMMIFTPTALGSFWALCGVPLVILIIIIRIINEEKVLIKELNGYEKYMERTGFRLFPGLW